MINRLNNTNSYYPGLYSHPNFKSKNLENPISEPKTQKTANQKALYTSVGVFAAAGSLLAALKNKKFAAGLSKFFKQYKNVLQETNFMNNVNLRQQAKDRFLNDFIQPLKNNPFKTNTFPSNGCIVHGPESRAKRDFFEWMVEELEKAGVKIIDPKPGKSPKHDDIYTAMHDLFYKDTTPAELRKKFQTEGGDFKALVVRNLDEIGQSQKYPNKKPLKYPEDSLLNDAPDTSDGVKRYGFMRLFSAKDIERLHPATVRSGRTDTEMIIMPYEDEAVEVWKNYIDYVKEHESPSYITRAIEMTKEVFSKKPAKEMEQILPSLEYQAPYQLLRLEEPMKKWRNWVQYMGDRKGVSKETKLNDFLIAVNNIASQKSTRESVQNREKVMNSKKFKAVSQLIKEKVLQLTPETKDSWDSIIRNVLHRGEQNLLRY